MCAWILPEPQPYTKYNHFSTLHQTKVRTKRVARLTNAGPLEPSETQQWLQSNSAPWTTTVTTVVHSRRTTVQYSTKKETYTPSKRCTSGTYKHTPRHPKYRGFWSNLFVLCVGACCYLCVREGGGRDRCQPQHGTQTKKSKTRPGTR